MFQTTNKQLPIKALHYGTIKPHLIDYRICFIIITKPFHQTTKLQFHLPLASHVAFLQVRMMRIYLNSNCKR
jgi:hypothetical protein